MAFWQSEIIKKGDCKKESEEEPESERAELQILFNEILAGKTFWRCSLGNHPMFSLFFLITADDTHFNYT